MSRIPCALACALVLFACIPADIPAQTWDKVFMNPGIYIFDLQMLPDGQHGWAIGNRGGGGMVISSLLRTRDGGASWESLSLPNADAYAFNGVFFITPERGWVVGKPGRIYRSDDGGDTWTQQTSGTGRTLSKVQFIDENNGWITGGWNDGSSYLVLKTDNGGANWQNLSFGSTAYSCEDLCFTDADHGWICGYDNMLDGHIHHTDDGGDTWVRQSVAAGLGVVSAIDFATPLIGWATTSSIYAAPAGAILHTNDGGASWKTQGHTYLDYNYGLDVMDAMNVAITSCQVLSPAQQRVFNTNDGGANWTGHNLPTAVYSYGIQYQAPDIWVGSQYAQILRSMDDGDSWDWEHHAPLWGSVAWSDAMTGWLVSGSHVGTDGYVLRSDDGGLSWAHDANAPGGSQVCFADDQHGWMVRPGNGGRVRRTTDGGDTWTEHMIGSASWLEGIFFIDEIRGWAHGGNGMIRRSDDGGQTWVGQSSGSGNYVQVVFFVDADEGWLAGGYGSGGGFIRHTTNGGDTWTAQTPAIGDHFTAGHFINNQEGWLGAVNGRVHKTTNGGDTWNVAGSVPHPFVDALLMEDASNGWLVARNLLGGGPPEDGRGFIYKTTDGGSSWTLDWEAPWPTGSISALASQAGGTLWACGNNATLLRHGDLTGVAEWPLTGKRILNYLADPNPFATSTRIRYTLTESSPVRLTLYDVRGRRVCRLINEVQGSGTHSTVWHGTHDNGRRLPSGVYFSRLETGDETQVRQIVYVK